MPGPLDFLQGATGAMASPLAAPMSLADLIARIMQSQQTPPPPKIQDQFQPGGTTDIAKSLIGALAPGMTIQQPPTVTSGAMPTPIPVQTTTITPPPWTTTTQAAPRGVPPMQLGLPPQPSQSYYGLLSSGFGFDPYKIPT